MDVSHHGGSSLDRRLQKVNDFLIMPVNLALSSMTKQIFFKPLKYVSSGANKPDPTDVGYRTLLVTNLSPYCSEDDIRMLFGVCGAIESIRFETRAAPSTSGEANVIEALQHLLKSKLIETEEGKEDDALSLHDQFAQSKLRRLERNIMGKADAGKLSFTKGGFALVVFEEESSVEYAMTKLTAMTNFGKFEKGEAKKSRGTKLWLKEWMDEHVHDPTKLQQAADEAIALYDQRQRQHKKIKEQVVTTQDNDGWTLVSKSGSKATVRASSGASVAVGGATQAQLRALKQAQDQRHIQKTFANTQSISMKNERLEGIRKRFEQDKAKVRRMERSKGRKFTPQ